MSVKNVIIFIKAFIIILFYKMQGLFMEISDLSASKKIKVTRVQEEPQLDISYGKLEGNKLLKFLTTD